MNTTIFAQRLKEARTSAKLTQSELCKISGVTAATISAYESADGNKGKNPSLDNALKLAQALNVSLDWLCGSLVNNAKIQISDFLKALVLICDEIPVAFDEVNYVTDMPKTDLILPNAAKALEENIDIFFTDKTTSSGSSGRDNTQIIEKFTFPAITFIDDKTKKFLRGWLKIKKLYDNNTIDESLYNLWLENQFKYMDIEQIKKKQKELLSDE